VHHADTVIVLVSTVIADLIVGGGWAVMALGLVLALRAWQTKQLAALPPGAEEEPPAALKLVFAGLSLFFWPAGLAMGLYFLSKPATVRAGVLCAWMLLLNFSLAVVAAIGIVTAGAVLMPELLFLPI
jgi:hypothetical protein